MSYSHAHINSHTQVILSTSRAQLCREDSSSLSLGVLIEESFRHSIRRTNLGADRLLARTRTSIYIISPYFHNQFVMLDPYNNAGKDNIRV